MADEITLDRLPSLTLDDLIAVVQFVWQRPDKKRTLHDTWLHTVHHAGALGEMVRRRRMDKIVDELADLVMWLLTFVGKLRENPKDREVCNPPEQLLYAQTSLSDMVWNKYPNICPACFFRLPEDVPDEQRWERPCDCLLHPEEVETRNEILTTGQKIERVAALHAYAERIREKKKISKMGELEMMFDNIYRANNQILSLEAITFHLLEEVGEVSDALLRIYTYDLKKKTPRSIYPDRLRDLESEIADLISWIFAVCFKLKNNCETYDILGRTKSPIGFGGSIRSLSERITFARLVWKRCGHPDEKSFWCSACREKACECSLLIATNDSNMRELL